MQLTAPSPNHVQENVWPIRLVAMWMGLNILDVLLTMHLLGIGGAEGNPFLAYVQDYVGAGPMLTLKLALALLAGGILLRLGRVRLLPIARRGMALVVLYNLAVLSLIVFV
ncbi:MAG: DUF5658 family protein [Dehalococcoidia bacterium]